MRNCKTLIRLLAAGAGLSLLLASCVRESAQEQDLVGQPICFDAWTVDADPETKTAFSGIVTGGIERINWEVDDRIRVACREVSWPAAQRYDYYLAQDEYTGKLSYATLNPHGSAHGLLWGEGSHTFYALYPSPTGSEVAFMMGDYYALARVTLPEDQSYTEPRTTETGQTYYGNMKLAYMLAANVVTEPSSNPVFLAFFPIVTTFYVTIRNTTGAAMTLRRVELSSADCALHGTYEAVIRNVNSLSESNLATTTFETRNFTNTGLMYTAVAVTDLNKRIYASFDDGLFMAPDAEVTVALFALPQGNPNVYPEDVITNVTLSVTSDETGTVSRLLTEGSPASPSPFAVGKKHNVTNVNLPPSLYEISVDKTLVEYDHSRVAGADQTFHVTSTRKVGVGSGPTYAASWKTQIKVSNTGNELVDWVDMTAENRPFWMSTYPLTSEEVTGIPTSGDDVGRVEIRKNVGEPPVQPHMDRLKEGKIYNTDGVTVVDNSTADKAVDLSFYDFVNRKLEGTRYTANTYIISAPGWYKFPCVYGNAIENGVAVPDSYTGQSGTGHLNTFKKAYGNLGTILFGQDSITDAWIENGYLTSASLVLQKFTRTENGLVYHSGNNFRESGSSDLLGVISQLSLYDYEDGRYIRFFVDPNKIQPGNAVIATRGSVPLASSNEITWSWQIWITDQNLSPVNVSRDTYSYDVLPLNLGWTDATVGSYHPEVSAQIRFVNTEGGVDRCVSETVTVSLPGHDEFSSTGWQPYYQWGRKDPMIYGLTRKAGDDDELKDVIRNPDLMYQDEPYLNCGYFDWSQNNYNNLWDSQWDSYGANGYLLPDHKTVYDPSPRRFCAPPEKVWEIITATGAFNEGYEFNTGSGSTIFLPAAGYINYDGNGQTISKTEGFYWASHAVGTTNTRTSFALHFLNGTVYPPSSDSNPDPATHHRANAYSFRPVVYQPWW